MKYKKILYNQLKNNIEPDCEDFYLCEIEEKAKKYDELIDYLKEKINNFKLKGCNYEKTYICGKITAYEEILSKIEKE